MTDHDGLFNIAKPAGMTSRDVVDHVVKVVGTKRVGHAGTLDPSATGVLVVAVGLATRLVEYVQQMPKTYEAEFRLGQTSDTDDADGAIAEVACDPPSEAALSAAIQNFAGTIEQAPPAFSAVKVAGRRAYQLARSGSVVALARRPVVIHDIMLREYRFPSVRLQIVCGSGTYIRSLARDLGEQLATGALMTRLERTAIGSFTLSDAVDLETLTRENWRRLRLPLSLGVSSLPRVALSEAEWQDFRHGRAIVRELDPAAIEGEVAAFDDSGRLLGIASATKDPQGRLILRVVKGGFRADDSFG